MAASTKKRDDSSSRATIRKIAQLAGVSISTVSRVMNDNPYVVEEKRQRVLEAAEKLNYRPSSAARRLRISTPATIGFVLSRNSLDHWFYSKVLDSVERACTEEGLHCLFAAWRERPEEPNISNPTPPLFVREKDVADGVIVCGDRYEPLLNTLDESGIPYICVGNNLIYLGIPRMRDAVYVDETGAAMEITTKLIEMGHTDIEFIGNLSRPEDRLRFDGFTRAMRQARLDYKQPAVLPQDEHIFLGRMVAERYVQKGTLPHAIFAAGGDDLACGLITRLREVEIRVPEDVSVAGFGGLRIWPIAPLEIATAAFPAETLGREAVKLLVQKLRLGGAPVDAKTVAMEIDMGKTVQRRK